MRACALHCHMPKTAHGHNAPVPTSSRVSCRAAAGHSLHRVCLQGALQRHRGRAASGHTSPSAGRHKSLHGVKRQRLNAATQHDSASVPGAGIPRRPDMLLADRADSATGSGSASRRGRSAIMAFSYMHLRVLVNRFSMDALPMLEPATHKDSPRCI